LRGRGPLFEAWRATFGPRATGWEPLIYTYVYMWSLSLHVWCIYKTMCQCLYVFMYEYYVCNRPV